MERRDRSPSIEEGGSGARILGRKGACVGLALSLLLTVMIGVSEGQERIIYGVAKAKGDSDTHRVLLNEVDDYAEIVKIIDKGTAHLQERSDPSLGLATWNPVEKFLYYASAEDGFASAYVTPYDTAIEESQYQRAMRGNTKTSFTLCSMQYNGRDAFIYGVITYSSGEHFLMRMAVNRTITTTVDPEVQFQPLLQLDFSHIVPGISAISTIEEGREYFYFVGIRQTQAYLVAVGADDSPVVEWELPLEGILTSMQGSGYEDVYGMLHNASGHFLVRWDSNAHINGLEPGDAKKESRPDEPEQSAETEVAVAIGSYTPNMDAYDPAYHTFLYETALVNGTRKDTLKFTSTNVVYTNANKEYFDDNEGSETRVVETGDYALTSVTIGFPRIPQLDQLDPSTAHFSGGMLVTVRGQPFVNTGPLIKCRWTAWEGDYDNGVSNTEEVYYSVSAVFIDSATIVCETPEIPSRLRTKMDLTLTDGLIWTLNTVDFTFFQITLREPIQGSSKGSSLIRIRGLLLQDLQQETSIKGTKLKSAACEFGIPPDEGGPLDLYTRQDTLPEGPQLRESSCVDVQIGLEFETVCTFTCFSPEIPRIHCDPDASAETKCLTYSLVCPETIEEARGVCRQKVRNYSPVPLAVNFFGQRIRMEGGWAYTGAEAPIVVGAKFLPDASGLTLELDLPTNKGRAYGQRMPASTYFQESDRLFGVGAYVIWVLPNRIRVYFGTGAQVLEDSFIELRPYTVASSANIYRYLVGSFITTALNAQDRVQPSAGLIAPQDVSHCSKQSVQAASSRISGGRALHHIWGVHARKCLDVKCMNSVRLKETSQIWLIHSQHRAYLSSAQHTVEPEMVLNGVSPSLDMMAGTKYTWMLQVRNFLFNANAIDLNNALCVGDNVNLEENPQCRVCRQMDSDICPGVSAMESVDMRVHMTPAPSIQLSIPSFLAVPHQDIKLSADIVVPNGDTTRGWLVDMACARAPHLSRLTLGDLGADPNCVVDPTATTDPPCACQVCEGSTVAMDLIKAQVSLRWSVSEIIMPEPASLDSLQRWSASKMSGLATGMNVITNETHSVFFSGNTLEIPKEMLSPRHFYKVTLSVFAFGRDVFLDPFHTSGVASATLFVTKRDIEAKIDIIAGTVARQAFTTAADTTFSGVDRIFIQAESNAWTTINVTAAPSIGLDNLDKLSVVEFQWTCLQWPSDTNFYWDDFEEISNKYETAKECTGFNFTENEPFPCCNRRDIIMKTVEFEDSTTYEFTLRIVVSHPSDTSDTGPQVSEAVQRIMTITRDNSAYRPLAELYAAVEGQNKLKVMPYSLLTINYGVIESTMDRSIYIPESGGCPADRPCTLELAEIGNTLDLTLDEVSVTESVTVFNRAPGQLIFRLEPDVVVPGARFLFRINLYARDRVYASLDLEVDVNTVPRNGYLEVNPAQGFAYYDKFSFDAIAWEDNPEDLPLRYTFSYKTGNNEEVALDGFRERTALETTLPLPRSVADDQQFSCVNPPTEFVCSTIQVFLYVQDNAGAETSTGTNVDLSIGSASLSYVAIHTLYRESQDAGFVSNDLPAMLNRLTQASELITEAEVEKAITAQKLEDPSTLPASDYQSAIMASIINFAEYNDGALLDSSPLISAQLSEAIDKTMAISDDIPPWQVANMLNIVMKSGSALAGVPTDLSVLQGVLDSSAQLIVSMLTNAGIFSASRRRLLSQSRRLLQNDNADSTLQAAHDFVDDITESVCLSALASAPIDNPAGPIHLDTSVFRTGFYTFGTSSTVRNSSVTIQGDGTVCGDLILKLLDWSNANAMQVCVVMFKYNPVAYSGVTTADGQMDGTYTLYAHRDPSFYQDVPPMPVSQTDSGVPWPIHPNSCPVGIKMYENNVEIERPMRLSLTFSVPIQAARTVLQDLPSNDGLVFFDLIFSGVCQQWGYHTQTTDPRGKWFNSNITTDIKSSDSNFVCNTSHWPEESLVDPPDLASGLVECIIPRPYARPNAQASEVFGVLTEKTDCAGVVDVPSRTGGGVPPGPDVLNWQRGQYAFLDGIGSSSRKVCDRCKVCGGSNDCALNCDSKKLSSAEVDLCGVCGGFVFAPEFTAASCAGVYVRYLGSKYPNDNDVGIDGLTSGKFFFDGPCPDELSFGFCTTIPISEEPPISYRYERYSYADFNLICWENSPLVGLDPNPSSDAVCQFQDRSLRIDDTDTTDANRTITVSVLNEARAVSSSGDLLMLYDASGVLQIALNGTNPLPAQNAPTSVLRNRFNLLQYSPQPSWNSLYPPSRYRYISFHVEGVPLTSEVKVMIRPVNDPPRVIAPTEPYLVQEDRPTLLDTPTVLRIDDDNEDIPGTTIDMTIRVLREGSSISIGLDGPFTSSISRTATVSQLNANLANLYFLGPENANDAFDPVSSILIEVSDRGTGGLAPYNQPFSDQLQVNITTRIMNDPPSIVMPPLHILFQNETTHLTGSHVVDSDVHQHQSSSPQYETVLSVSHGEVTMAIFGINCSVNFFMPLPFKAVSVVYVDETLPDLDDPLWTAASTEVQKYPENSLLKVDGRSTSNERKAFYVSFEQLGQAADILDSYPGGKVLLSLFKRDCYDINDDSGPNPPTDPAAQGNSILQTCTSGGNVAAHYVAAGVVGADTEKLDWGGHTAIKSQGVAGYGEYSTINEEWVDFWLNAEDVITQIRSNGGRLAFQIVADETVQDTLRFDPGNIGTTYSLKHGREEDRTPKLEFLMGSASNLTFNDPAGGNCSLQMLEGSGTDDSQLRFQANLQTTNDLIENITYNIRGGYSNAIGNEPASVSMAVLDVSAQATCAAQVLTFGPQDCTIPSTAQTAVRIIPYKQDRIQLHMQPWYEDRWIREKSVAGELPVVVALEDCGNRGWTETCPSKLQFVPSIVDGEYAFGRFSVELSARIGTITVPASLRDKLEFSKGSGFRDQVVRFTGFAPDVRAAMLDIEYHSPLDQSLQYANQYSTEQSNDNLPCARACFFQDVGPPAFQNAEEVAGCSQGCASRIVDRAQDFNKTRNERGLFLDDVIITFTDNGVTGIGLTAYTTLQLYNIYTVAVNDQPCIVFKGRVSQGCRQKCANTGLPSNCDDSGLPFDISQSFSTKMFEGSEEPIFLGGMVSKTVDEYESSRVECRTELAQNLARRGDGVTDPTWLEECPRFNVRISALQGWLALNSRENIDIYIGAGQTFFSPIAFLGYPVDINAAMRMLRYQTADGNIYFNRNLGRETVTLEVKDQGFSGSDQTGEFDGTNAQSVLDFDIDIVPVNNPPQVQTPRATDPIEVQENVAANLAAGALDPGLDVQDVDSDECATVDGPAGRLNLKLSVPHGRIYVVSRATEQFEALADASQERMSFFADPDCQESLCAAQPVQGNCDRIQACLWSSSTKTCSCRTVRAGKQCRDLTMKGLQADIQQAMKAVVYVPQIQTNYLNWDTPEVLGIRVSDQEDPDDPSNGAVSCGEVLGIVPTWVEAEANIRTLPVNQQCGITIDPVIKNPSFEFPVTCEGHGDCDEDLHQNAEGTKVQCVGVEESPSAGFEWTIEGKAGITFAGWIGDVNSADGDQHLYLAPVFGTPSKVSQNIEGLVPGADYLIRAQVGARAPLPPLSYGGGGFRLTLGDPTTTLDADIPQITIEEARNLPGIPFQSYSTTTFVAGRESYAMQLEAYIDSSMKPATRRMVFVDDIEIKFQSYNIPEGQPLFLKSLRIFDPDYIQGIIDLMVRNGVDFNFKVSLSCKYGLFKLVYDRCTVMPAENQKEEQGLANILTWATDCSEFYNDPSLLAWAELPQAIRGNCPENWVGSGTTTDPCVNLPLESLNATWNAYVSGTPLVSQIYQPQRYAEFTGSKENLEMIMQTRFFYEPDEYFNTDNLGKEFITATIDDLGNFNGDPTVATQQFAVHVHAVNNEPNVTFENPFIEIDEDTTTTLTGVRVSDPDLDEIICLGEPCDKGIGTMILKVLADNATVIPSSASSTDIEEQFLEAFAAYTSNLDILRCAWKVSCTPLSGYLTLANDNFFSLCNNDIDRCDPVMYYCISADLALTDLNSQVCIDFLKTEDFEITIQSDGFRQAEIDLQTKLFGLVGTGTMLSIVKPRFVQYMGSQAQINSMLRSHPLDFRPDPFLNGVQLLQFIVNDLANVGIGYPCPQFSTSGEAVDIRDEIQFQHCSETVPRTSLQVSQTMTISIIPVNNRPLLYMYDQFGVTRLDELESMSALQNVTKFLNKLEVEDVDILEDPTCVMTVEIATRSGGQLVFNSTKAPFMIYLPNPTGTLIAATGTIQEINIMMSNLEYTSDPQFVGVENIFMDVYDNGCTGKDISTSQFEYETFQIQVAVTKPKTCQFTTCVACVSQTTEACGWCPSSCKGAGKCSEAQSIGGAPLYTVCAPLCIEGSCVGWNQCEAPPSRSWMIGAIGSPMLFVALICTYMLFMWARREHGTLPVYFNKASRGVISAAKNLYIAPRPGAKIGQLVFLFGCVVLAGLFPGISTSVFAEKRLEFSLGEALTFTLETDGCEVVFMGIPGANRSDPAVVSTLITANGSLSGVVMSTDFCLEDQFIKINNSRLDVERYSGYSCHVQIRIPTDPDHTIPIMKISNVGTQATIVRNENPAQTINFGANRLELEGTAMNVELTNLKARTLNVPFLDSGLILINNATFTSMVIATTAADVRVSVSPEDSMTVPITLSYHQPENSVCLVSKDDGGAAYTHTNNCQQICKNVTTATNETVIINGEPVIQQVLTSSIVCSWECSSLTPSRARLIPFKRDLQPGLSDIQMDVTSVSGQVYVQHIPDDRVPPSAGLAAFDTLYVYDGIADTRKLSIRDGPLKLLDNDFHPGGASRPKADWFELTLTGPGTPPGTFIWVSDSRYLLIDRLMLQVLTMGMLVPSESSSNLPFKHSVCPSFDLGPTPEQKYSVPLVDVPLETVQERRRRHLLQTETLPDVDPNSVGNIVYLTQFYELLYTAVNARDAPPASVLAYRPKGFQPFLVFSRTQDGKISLSQISIFDRPLVQGLLLLGLLIPGSVALVGTSVLLLKARGLIKQFRETRYEQENATRLLLDLSSKKSKEEKEDAQEKAYVELQAEFYKKTNFFYFLDNQLGDPESALSIQSELTFSFIHICAIGVAVGPLLVFGTNYHYARDWYSCPLTDDEPACLANTPGPTLAVYSLVGLHGVISFLELYAFYANLPWSSARKIPIIGWSVNPRKALRLLWYGSQAVMTLLSLFYILTVVVWCFIGVIVLPAQFLPYVLGCGLSLVSITRLVYRMRGLQERVLHAVEERAEKFINRQFGNLPKEVVRALVNRQVHKLLKQNGMTKTAVVNAILFLLAVLFLVQAFLYIGFQALTDVTSVMLGVFKAIVTAICIIAVDEVINRKRDNEIQKQDMNKLVKDILAEASRGVYFVLQQIEVGELLLKEMQKRKRIEEARKAREELENIPEFVTEIDMDEYYEMQKDAAKMLIHDDRFGGDDREDKKLGVPLQDEYPVTEMNMLQPEEPTETYHLHPSMRYGPNVSADSDGVLEAPAPVPQPFEPPRAAADQSLPMVVLTLDEDGPVQELSLQLALADIFDVSPSRFRIITE